MEESAVIRGFSLLDGQGPVLTRLVRQEDGEPYEVWRVECGAGRFILKRAKEYEAEVYRELLPGVGAGAPVLYQTADVGGSTYLLMEFVEGADLCRCGRRGLTLALDALIAMQKATWNDQARAGFGYTFEKSLKDRRHRGEYLGDPGLEAAYARFMSEYASVPRALCHDDLLPFNVIVSGDRAVMIDWEFAGILPYPVSFARLIAHGEEDEAALFRMSRADRDFAVRYYYENLLRGAGISWEEWRRTLELFLFYEFCEWVFIGNKYPGANEGCFKKYLGLAVRQAELISGMGRG